MDRTLRQCINEITSIMNENKTYNELVKTFKGFHFDGESFDFDYGKFTFTISTDKNGKLYLVNNVGVNDKQGYIIKNVPLNSDEY